MIFKFSGPHQQCCRKIRDFVRIIPGDFDHFQQRFGQHSQSGLHDSIGGLDPRLPLPHFWNLPSIRNSAAQASKILRPNFDRRERQVRGSRQRRQRTRRRRVGRRRVFEDRSLLFDHVSGSVCNFQPYLLAGIFSLD